MKRIICLLLASFMIMGMQSCKSKKNIAKEEKKPAIAGANVASPPVIIYKTKKDYRDLVPVVLNKEKTRIVSYPAPSDVISGREMMTPRMLEGGFLLDKRGISENVAFLRLTYNEYSKMKKVPSTSELLKMVIDNDPISEMYKCGRVGDYKELERELNQMIKQGKLTQFERLK